MVVGSLTACTTGSVAGVSSVAAAIGVATAGADDCDAGSVTGADLAAINSALSAAAPVVVDATADATTVGVADEPVSDASATVGAVDDAEEIDLTRDK